MEQQIKTKKRNITIAVNIALFVIAVTYVLLFCMGTSVLFPDFWAYDGTIFMYEGAGMLHGRVPYKDMFEIKGPMLFFIQWLGQLIYHGRLGAMLLEMINFTVIIFCTYYIARQFLSVSKSFIAVGLSLIYWCGFLRYGNTVEEYAMGFTMIALYIFVKDLVRDNFVNCRHYFLYGVLAMCAALTRLTECAIVGGVLIYVFIHHLRKKDIREAAILFGIALSGCAAVLTPFLVYFGYHHALYDMLDGMLLFSLRYAGFNRGTLLDYRRLGIIAFLIFIAVFVMIKKRHRLGKFTGLLSAILLILFMATGMTYEHYMIVAIPCFLLSFIIAIDTFDWKNKKKGKRNFALGILFALFLFCCNIWPLGGSFKHVVGGLRQLARLDPVDDAVIFANKIDDLIESEYRNSVYHYECPPSIPYITDTYSTARHFVFQDMLSGDPDRKEMIYKEFDDSDAHYVVMSKGAWLTYNTESGKQNSGCDTRILDILKKEYTEKYGSEKFVLLERRETQKIDNAVTQR